MADREKKNPMRSKNQSSMSAYFGAKKKKDKISATSTVAAGHSSISRLLSCAGAYNASSGKNKAVVSIYCKYIAPLTTQPFHVGNTNHCQPLYQMTVQSLVSSMDWTEGWCVPHARNCVQ